MNMARLEKIPNEYNEEVQRMDEQIFKLIHDRKEKAKGKPFVPPEELQEKWAKEFGMKQSEIGMFVHSLNHGSGHALHGESEKGELQGVLPIMKRSSSADWDIRITHAMQYEKASEVTVEASYQKEVQARVHLRVDLMLQVHGGDEYVARFHGGGGGGGNMQVKYLVTPRLPDNLDSVKFTLIPHAMPFHQETKLVVLDQVVEFE
ncbi:MAG TPA: hypothetical protein VFK37_02510 [Bacillales bacterium]|nr:hypothetical protein [Bacillales bacterium]